MSLPLYCSNILLDQPFLTANDFTISFTYTMNTSGTDPILNNGFSVFFIDGSVSTLSGGGSGPGLGVVSQGGSHGRPQPVSKVNGVFATVGFDIIGTFSQINTTTSFSTGLVNPNPNSIALRISPNFTYVYSSYLNLSGYTIPLNPNLYGPLGPAATPEAYQTVRVCVRKNFSEINVYSLANETYIKLATFNFYLSSLPLNAKVGIGYSGDTLFQVQNLTVNYT